MLDRPDGSCTCDAELKRKMLGDALRVVWPTGSACQATESNLAKVCSGVYERGRTRPFGEVHRTMMTEPKVTLASERRLEGSCCPEKDRRCTFLDVASEWCRDRAEHPSRVVCGLRKEYRNARGLRSSGAGEIESRLGLSERGVPPLPESKDQGENNKRQPRL